MTQPPLATISANAVGDITEMAIVCIGEPASGITFLIRKTAVQCVAC